MSKNELVAKIEALNEWEAVIEEAKAEEKASSLLIAPVLMALKRPISITISDSLLVSILCLR